MTGYVPLGGSGEGEGISMESHSIKRTHSGGAKGDNGKHPRSQIPTMFGAALVATCLLAAVFDQPMTMKAEDRAVARGAAPMVQFDGLSKPAMRARSGMLVEHGGEAKPAGEAKKMDSFTFLLPASAKPGQVIHVMVPGANILHDVKVPADAKPGQSMMIQLPAEPKLAETKEGGAKEGEEKKEERGPMGMTGKEEVRRLEDDVVELPVDVEHLGTFHGETTFWRHWFLCVLTFVLGCTLLVYSIRGVFHGFGPIEVDPRKLPDHPCRFSDPHVAELAQGHLDMYGDEGMPSTRRSAEGAPRLPVNSAPRKGGSMTPKGTASPRKPDPVLSGASKGGSGEDASGDEPWYAEAKSADVWLEVWNRGKWLLVLLLFQSTSSIILSSFEELIKHHLVLALFLTMLVGAGGNAGAQSVVKDITIISSGHTPGSQKEWQRAWVRTGIVAVALSFFMGFAALLRVWLFHGTVQEAFAISLSCGLIVFSAVLVGTALPFAMIWCGFDPLHSGAVIQVLMDIWGVIVSCLVCQVMLGGPDAPAGGEAAGAGR
uniref:SLC41A/MgtE integral membrane domain-containing protein n=1 Tax=Hemiselmis tepida TaxID=464990 RepID=A0A7S0V580_9CRYP|mmetsp:Transcript_11291/g.29352  ORF Transcript_11291/g.29352 Transcript_11291/m.29352 type:complete len:544 (+) Transcript_11291:22-1653(+)